MYVEGLSGEELEKAAKWQQDILDGYKKNVIMHDNVFDTERLQEQLDYLSRGKDKALSRHLIEKIREYLPSEEILPDLASISFSDTAEKMTEVDFDSFMEGYYACYREIIGGIK